MPGVNPLLNVFHLALCGGDGTTPRVLYASINLLSASRIDSSYSLKPDKLEVLDDDLFQSHSAAGLYRLQWAKGPNAGMPVDVENDQPWDQPEGAVVFRHIAGLGAAQEALSASGNVGSGGASDLNYPQAWRNITSITGTRTGHLAVTTRAVMAVHDAVVPLTFDGGVFVSHSAALATPAGELPMEPKFDLLFTHPWAAASAFYDQPGAERLFVGLDMYGKLEADPKDISATPLTDVLESRSTELISETLLDHDGEYRNDYYFTDSSPQLPRWPVGVFEVAGWKLPSTIESLSDIHDPPSVSASVNSADTLQLVELTDNVASVVHEWLRMSVFGDRLLAGGRGSGGFWRKVPGA